MEQARKAELYFGGFLAREGYTWAGMVLEDEGEQGNPFSVRPGAARLNAGLRAGDAVVIPASKWVFKSLLEFVGALTVFFERDIRTCILDFELELKPEWLELAGAANRTLREAMARDHSERQRAVVASRKRAGLSVGACPYGFRAVGRQGRRRLVPDPQQRAFGARVLGMRLAGKTWQGIYFELLYGGVRRPDGREWSLMAIWRAAQGELRLREREQAGGLETGPPP